MDTAPPAIDRVALLSSTATSTAYGSSASTTPAREIPSWSAAIFGPLGAGWWLTQPLAVTFERDDDGWWIVSDDVFLVYGMGKDRSQAYKDYVASLLEYYQLVEKGATENPYDQTELAHLQSYLRHVQNGHAG